MNRFSFATSVAFLVATMFVATNSRPIEHDPLMALPSSARQQHIVVEQPAAQPQNVEVQYVYMPQQQQPSEHQQETTVLTQEQYQQLTSGSQPQQQLVPATAQTNGQLEAPYQLVQVPQSAPVHLHNGVSCNKRHELQTALPAALAQTVEPARAAEYPGEIIYIGQNNNNEQSVGNSQRRDYLTKAAAETLGGDNSGLPATILTEVPINEMPLEILAKLKKDYGVKVVATRERPGANLVINCDEYSQQQNSICNRQSSSISYESSLGEQNHQVLSHPYSAGVVPSSENEQTYHQYVNHPQMHQYQTPSSNNGGAEQEYVMLAPGTQPHHYEYRSVVQPSHYVNYEQSGPTATSPASENPETHAIEYLPSDSRSAAGSDDQTNEAYGTRTTVAMNEQPEQVVNVSPNDSPAGPAQPETVEHHQPQQDQNGHQAGGEVVVSTAAENDAHHGFDEQPKSASEQEQAKPSDNESGYQEARQS